ARADSGEPRCPMARGLSAASWCAEQDPGRGRLRGRPGPLRAGEAAVRQPARRPRHLLSHVTPGLLRRRGARPGRSKLAARFLPPLPRRRKRDRMSFDQPWLLWLLPLAALPLVAPGGLPHDNTWAALRPRDRASAFLAWALRIA